MNTVSLELGLLLLGEPPYPAAKASELLELLASSHEAVCPAADLTRLEHVAGAIASGRGDRRGGWALPAPRCSPRSRANRHSGAWRGCGHSRGRYAAPRRA